MYNYTTYTTQTQCDKGNDRIMTFGQCCDYLQIEAKDLQALLDQSIGPIPCSLLFPHAPETTQEDYRRFLMSEVNTWFKKCSYPIDN